MKTSRFFAALMAVALSFNFVSCGDDDEPGGGGTGSGSAAKRVIRVIDTNDRGKSTTYDFDYDDEGRVVSIYGNMGEWFSEDITYSGNQAAVHYENPGEYTEYTEKWTLNEQNCITSVSVDGDVWLELAYTDGFLTKYTDGEDNTEATNYVYKDGLLISNDDGVKSITYTDIPNIGNICVDEVIYDDYQEYGMIGLLGRAYKLLPARMIIKDGGGDTIITYEYELDGDGYVKSVAETSEYPGGKYASTREFVYADVK